MTIVEKAAFLKGLTEGLDLEPNSKDARLWGALNDLLADMAHEIEDLHQSDMDFADTLDEMSEDLSYLEELTCDLDTPEDMDDYSDCEGDCTACAGCCSDVEDEDSEDESDEDEELSYDGVLYDVTCPNCGEEITFDEEKLDEGFTICPGCGEKLEFDLGDDDEKSDDGKEDQ